MTMQNSSKNMPTGSVSSRPHTLDNQEYFQFLRELLAEGRSVSLLVSGNSMSPFLIHHRDSVLLSPITAPPKKGDILLYQRENGSYILHRLQRVQDNQYYFVGDAQREIEGPLLPSQCIGVVTKVERKGKPLTSKSLLWKFFAKPWLYLLPFRAPLRSCVDLLYYLFNQK